MLRMPDPLDGPVIKVDVRDLNVIRKRLLLHRKAVVLTGDFNLPSGKLLYRMVPTPVSELQLVGGSTHGACKHLMAKTDAEHWYVCLEYSPHIRDGIRQWSRVTGTIAQKHAIGMDCQQIASRGRRRKHADTTAVER